jgi:hypothetical protein
LRLRHEAKRLATERMRRREEIEHRNLLTISFSRSRMTARYYYRS